MLTGVNYHGMKCNNAGPGHTNNQSYQAAKSYKMGSPGQLVGKQSFPWLGKMTAVKMLESGKAKMIRATALNLVGVVPLCCCQGS